MGKEDEDEDEEQQQQDGKGRRNRNMSGKRKRKRNMSTHMFSSGEGAPNTQYKLEHSALRRSTPSTRNIGEQAWTNGGPHHGRAEADE